MSEATEMITGISSLVWTPFYATLIISLLFWTSYSFIAKIFKWLTLVLFAYIIAAFLAHRGLERERHVAMLRGFDELAFCDVERRASIFLVARHDHGDRGIREGTGLLERSQRGEEDDVAALHVADAGTRDDVALAREALKHRSNRTAVRAHRRAIRRGRFSRWYYFS